MIEALRRKQEEERKVAKLLAEKIRAESVKQNSDGKEEKEGLEGRSVT
jgi:hypothetical protein